MNVRDYATASRDSLRLELVIESDFLVANQIILAGATGDRERVYWHAYGECDDSATVSARDKIASHASLANALDVIQAKGEIAACQTKIALIRDLLA